jgi:hypothetical protein
VSARDGPGRSELARPKEPSAAIHMELGQSTVLGLAIVGDDGGVGEADFQKVRGQAPGRATRPSLSALPPLTASAVWHVRSWRKRRQKRPGRRAPTRTWRRWAWRARRARCVRARCAPLPCVARPGAHAHWPRAAARLPSVDDAAAGSGQVQRGRIGADVRTTPRPLCVVPCTRPARAPCVVGAAHLLTPRRLARCVQWRARGIRARAAGSVLDRHREPRSADDPIAAAEYELPLPAGAGCAVAGRPLSADQVPGSDWRADLSDQHHHRGWGGSACARLLAPSPQAYAHADMSAFRSPLSSSHSVCSLADGCSVPFRCAGGVGCTAGGEVCL